MPILEPVKGDVSYFSRFLNPENMHVLHVIVCHIEIFFMHRVGDIVCTPNGQFYNIVNNV